MEQRPTNRFLCGTRKALKIMCVLLVADFALSYARQARFRMVRWDLKTQYAITSDNLQQHRYARGNSTVSAHDTIRILSGKYKRVTDSLAREDITWMQKRNLRAQERELSEQIQWWHRVGLISPATAEQRVCELRHLRCMQGSKIAYLDTQIMRRRPFILRTIDMLKQTEK